MAELKDVLPQLRCIARQATAVRPTDVEAPYLPPQEIDRVVTMLEEMVDRTQSAYIAALEESRRWRVIASKMFRWPFMSATQILRSHGKDLSDLVDV